MIELREVTRHWESFSLKVSCTVEEGEFLTLLGPSGSGKSTTLRILAGFETAESGTILLYGEDITERPPQTRQIGYVFQDYTLFPHLTVGENIAYGLRVLKATPREQQQRVDELLALVGLTGFGSREVHTLSGGEQQRVAVARAIAPRPRALLLDEPFSAIDTERRETLRDHLLRIQRELRLPTIFVTHSRAEALYLSDRIIIMRNGAVEDEGTPERLYQAPATEYAATFLGKTTLFEFPGSEGRRMMIRPEHVRMYRAPLAGRISGTIMNRGYYGAAWEYTITGVPHTVPAGTPVIATAAERFERGEPVWIELPPSRMVSLPQ
jgi:ABC-type Fe3+/spermidine/putrescine transport system ATPase subunit